MTYTVKNNMFTARLDYNWAYNSIVITVSHNELGTVKNIILRQDGEFEESKAIVDAILELSKDDLTEQIPQTKAAQEAEKRSNAAKKAWETRKGKPGPKKVCEECWLKAERGCGWSGIEWKDMPFAGPKKDKCPYSEDGESMPEDLVSKE